MVRKILIVAVIVFGVFLVSGIAKAQDTENKSIKGAEITYPSDGQLVPRRIPVKGTVEFTKVIKEESYIVFVSVKAADQKHYLVSWNRTLRHAKLSTELINGKNIANWEIGDIYGPAYIGRENADIGKEFHLQAIVLRASDFKKFEDKYYTALPKGEVCIMDKNDFKDIDKNFPGSVVSEPIKVIRTEGER